MIRIRRPFVLSGRVPVSKSWLNRALILRSLFPDLQILDWEPSELDGDDVAHLNRALQTLAVGETDFEIGESGAGLRFLIARLSVEKNRYKIRGTSRLLGRPHAELFQALEKVGTKVTQMDANTLMLDSQGWPAGDVELEIETSESSQFASAMNLAASRSKFEFNLRLTGVARSLGYLDMTRDLVNSVKAGRRRLVPEADASSIATLAIIAVAASEDLAEKNSVRLSSASVATEEKDLSIRLDTLEEQVRRTKQPDRTIFEILRRARSPEGLRAFSADLTDAPDLFPCLAALACFARLPSSDGATVSVLSGAPHLRLKESDRIAGMARLFEICGIECHEQSGGMTIHPLTIKQKEEFSRLRRLGLAFQFDPENDHRLAFAAAVLAAGGIPIEVSRSSGLARGVVAKSFPQFWSLVEGDAPRVALIGHRGTGKTQTARRWGAALGARATVIDLDREIERLAGRSTRDVFENQGELEFRWFEQQAWREIDVETRNSVGAVIVSTGAGFDPSLIDDSWTRVWLRRSTDVDGRVFTDRPRLDVALGPIEEARSRFKMREPRYEAYSDRVLELGEGASLGADASEIPWLGDLFDQDLAGGSEISGIGGAVTLLPGQDLVATCERLLRWGVQRIEIRDDIFPPSAHGAAWKFFSGLPADRLLISFREISERAETVRRVMDLPDGLIDRLAVDFDVSDPRAVLPIEILARADRGELMFVASVHGSAKNNTRESLIEIEAKFKSVPHLLVKAALDTADFKTLRVYHEWMSESRSKRVFLPMTEAASLENSRWGWYRAWLGKKAALNFWREGNGTSFDQPTFSQWWRRARFATTSFAAVLGDPVRHSRTPLNHDSFFSQRGLPVFAIRLPRAEVVDGLPMLFELGLRAAAVTAPLKEEIVGGGRAVNTLAIGRTGMTTTNTDNIGFQKLWDEAKDVAARMQLAVDLKGRDVVVWGGGGVLGSVAHVLPDAIFYSSSKGQPREGQVAVVTQNPSIVVWAGGQDRGAWPTHWKPRLIADLSYTENSMGRVIAIETGARHVSGLSMFEAQAAAQVEFWEELLKDGGVER